MVVRAPTILDEDSCVPAPSCTSSSVSFLCEAVKPDNLLACLEIIDDGKVLSPLVAVLANLLQNIVDTNESSEAPAGLSPSPRLTVFHGLRTPPISLPAYLERIAKYAKCSPVSFVAAFFYIHTLAEKDATFQPTHLNVHRLVITTVMLAAKFLDDKYYNNSFYARIGGVTVAELNRLEVETLKLLQWRLYISPEVARYYVKHIMSGSGQFPPLPEALLNVAKKRRSCSEDPDPQLAADRRHRRSEFLDGSQGC